MLGDAASIAMELVARVSLRATRRGDARFRIVQWRNPIGCDSAFEAMAVR
jgi:hypothetical protein